MVAANFDDGDEGYNSDIFVDKKDLAEYRCGICTSVLRNPAETELCGHLFCSGCWVKLPKSGDNRDCPICKKKTKVHITKFLQRKINSFKTKCQHQGCDWEGPLKSRKEHLSACQKRPVPCRFSKVGCKFCGQAKDLKEHYTLEAQKHNEMLEKALVQANESKVKMKAELDKALSKVKDGKIAFDAQTQERLKALNITHRETIKDKDAQIKKLNEFIERSKHNEELKTRHLKQQIKDGQQELAALKNKYTKMRELKDRLWKYPYYKTKMCINHPRCRNGDSCHYAHGSQDLRVTGGGPSSSYKN